MNKKALETLIITETALNIGENRKASKKQKIAML
jgi:hypothetical protein